MLQKAWTCAACALGPAAGIPTVPAYEALARPMCARELRQVCAPVASRKSKMLCRPGSMPVTERRPGDRRDRRTSSAGVDSARLRELLEVRQQPLRHEPSVSRVLSVEAHDDEPADQRPRRPASAHSPPEQPERPEEQGHERSKIVVKRARNDEAVRSPHRVRHTPRRSAGERTKSPSAGGKASRRPARVGRRVTSDEARGMSLSASTTTMRRRTPRRSGSQCRAIGRLGRHVVGRTHAWKIQ